MIERDACGSLGEPRGLGRARSGRSVFGPALIPRRAVEGPGDQRCSLRGRVEVWASIERLMGELYPRGVQA